MLSNYYHEINNSCGIVQYYHFRKKDEVRRYGYLQFMPIWLRDEKKIRKIKGTTCLTITDSKIKGYFGCECKSISKSKIKDKSRLIVENLYNKFLTRIKTNLKF
jgi:hypothetical protein